MGLSIKLTQKEYKVKSISKLGRLMVNFTIDGELEKFNRNNNKKKAIVKMKSKK